MKCFKTAATCQAKRVTRDRDQGRPVASKYQRLDAEKLEAAKAEFHSLEQQGIISTTYGEEE